MAVEAGRRALENGHVLPEKIDMILVSTITPNAVIPGVAFQVQAALGLSLIHIFLCGSCLELRQYQMK